MCYVAVCGCIRSAELLSSSLPQNDLFYLKEKAYPDRAKTPHENTPPHVYVTTWKYLHNAAQMFTQIKKAWFQNRNQNQNELYCQVCSHIRGICFRDRSFHSATE